MPFHRGTNVGGRAIKKEKLQETFTTPGFRDVTTYKQSGNVIFETTTSGVDESGKRVEEQFRRALGHDVPAFVRTVAHLEESRAGIISASGAVVFSPTHGGGEGALPNPFPESRFKARITTRNMNVIREIAQMYDDVSEGCLKT